MDEIPRVPCPSCGKGTLKMITQPVNIPYFKETMITSLTCDLCGYRHSDVFIASQNRPMRYTYSIESREDMEVRVIRSSTATYSVPEIGVMVEPATATPAFVTNIEGVLERMAEAVSMAARFNREDPSKVERADEILSAIEDIRNGKSTATFILDDPLGNSAVVSFDEEADHRLSKRELTREEAEALECPITFSDVDELRDPDNGDDRGVSVSEREHG